MKKKLPLKSILFGILSFFNLEPRTKGNLYLFFINKIHNIEDPKGKEIKFAKKGIDVKGK